MKDVTKTGRCFEVATAIDLADFLYEAFEGRLYGEGYACGHPRDGRRDGRRSMIDGEYDLNYLATELLARLPAASHAFCQTQPETRNRTE